MGTKVPEMTPALKQTYMVIDEWWKKYGYAPSIDEIMFITGEKGRGNVSRKIQMLIRLGVCKGIPGRARTVRPSYMRVHKIE
jgi:SOS-response transcriptional repressor LexA